MSDLSPMDIVKRNSPDAHFNLICLIRGFDYLRRNKIMLHKLLRDIISPLEENSVGLNFENGEFRNYSNMLDCAIDTLKEYEDRFSGESGRRFDANMYISTVNEVTNNTHTSMSYKDILIHNSVLFADVVDKLREDYNFYNGGYKSSVKGSIYAYTWGFVEWFNSGDYKKIADSYREVIDTNVLPYVGDAARIKKDIEILKNPLVGIRDHVANSLESDEPEICAAVYPICIDLINKFKGMSMSIMST